LWDLYGFGCAVLAPVGVSALIGALFFMALLYSKALAVFKS
jgi:hypothetical protein